MNAAIPVIAVFDIGKTNKKVFLFDEGYKIAYEHTDKFSEIKDEDGDPCEDLALLSQWCTDTFEELKALRQFSIKAVNFSAYGASFVHIDEKGNPILPLYNYLKPYPPELKKKFFDEYGGERSVSMVTASPVLDSLNSGLQLYRLKYEKNLFATSGYSLHLPQYMSYLITGKAYSDITSLGCHTMLWDFPNNTYHEWVGKENIGARLAPLFPCDEIIEVDDDPHASDMSADDFNVKIKGSNMNDIAAGVGLHDSSAALIPYLSGFHQPFILISTGTWCISLNPFNDEPLTASELEQDCLCYMTYKGRPVKASRLFAGHEHELQVKILAEHFGKDINHFEKIYYNPETVKYLKENFNQGVPESLNDGSQKYHDSEYFSPGPSVFQERKLSSFRNYEEAYHQLIIDIMWQQVRSTQLVLQKTQPGSHEIISGPVEITARSQGMAVKRLFVDGGFSKNPVYMNLLALSFPDLEVFAASVAQATAIGAALAIHRHWNSREIPSDLIDLKYYASAQL